MANLKLRQVHLDFHISEVLNNIDKNFDNQQSQAICKEKNANALRYEAALLNAYGANCSIDDRLHSLGDMQMPNCELIEQIQAEVKQRQPWCVDAAAVADIAVLSSEAFAITPNQSSVLPEVGANRMLLAGNYLYDIVDAQTDYMKYKVLILPDTITVTDALKEKLQAYLQKGGKILASGQSGLNLQGDAFALDFGLIYQGKHLQNPTYCESEFPLIHGQTQYRMGADAYTVSLAGAQQVVSMYEADYDGDSVPCGSHQQLPNDCAIEKVGVAMTENTAYIAWDIFTDYAQSGQPHLKELVQYVVDTLLDDGKTLLTNLPDRGVVTLMEQEKENRMINHLLYGHASVRGAGDEMREDIDVMVAVKTSGKPSRVYLAPQDEDLDFTYENGVIQYTVPNVQLDQMVVLDGVRAKKTCCCCCCGK